MENDIFRVIEYKEKIEIDNLYKKLSSKKGFIFLDSSMVNRKLGRFSVFVFEPFMEFISKGKQITVINNNKKLINKTDPFKTLNIYIEKYKTNFKDKRIPFISGAVGYISYETANILEKLPEIKENIINMPDMHFGFYNKSIIFDNIKNKVYITITSIPYRNKSEKHLLKKVSEIKELIKADFKNEEMEYKKDNIKLVSNFTREEYIKKVKRVKEYIKDGDIYQVNLSQRFSCKTDIKPHDLYLRLRINNMAPFCAYLNLGDVFVLSTSPERFIKLENGFIETRPIKGTRKRGMSKKEDKILRSELLKSSKDRAELTMIVDLERNDIGKVSKFGSVKVEKLFSIENYMTVIHMVSKITGVLKKSLNIIDLLKATFPGGSITGAPKIRSMEIINELETCSRNVYTGCIGYIDFNGNSDFNIAIRTIIMKDNTLIFNVGGGIVADSVPEDEYQETIHKGKAIIETLKNI
jgi:para-aminobenzoate synthetase component 1